MDLIDELRNLSVKVLKYKDIIKGEEGTKTSLIIPFLQALGYNTADPNEVNPELTADVGVKKGEKVDYAILKDGKPIILIECKWCGDTLGGIEHGCQLFRYFSVSGAKFAILTNGIFYKFYTDADEKNKMDAKPFLEFDILNIQEAIVEELKRFTKEVFNQDEVFNAAINLKYMNGIKVIMAKQLIDPDDQFTKFFAAQVYSGKLMQNKLEEFKTHVTSALNQFISDRVNDRLKSALAQEQKAVSENEKKQLSGNDQISGTNEEPKLTEEELQGLYIIKSIMGEITDPKRISARNTKSYCGIILDNNNRKTICRLFFSSTKKSLGLIKEDKNFEKFPIEDINGIYKYKEQLKSIVNSYEKQKNREKDVEPQSNENVKE